MNAAENKRLLALDILRGITIAGMILVNNPGSWSAIYAPLEHASWNGLTPTDPGLSVLHVHHGGIDLLVAEKIRFPVQPRHGTENLAASTGDLPDRRRDRVVLKILRHVQRAVGRRSSVLGTDRTFVLDVRPDADPRRDATPGAELRRGGADRRNGSPPAHPVDRRGTARRLFRDPAVGTRIRNVAEQNVVGIVDRAILGPAHMYRGRAISPFDPEGLLSTDPVDRPRADRILLSAGLLVSAHGT